MPKIIDLTHRVFDRLTVVRKLLPQQSGDRVRWECRCRCGSTKTVIGRTNQLTSGLLRSCGCLHREVVKKNSTKHGLYGSREYSAWQNIIGRCCSQQHHAFHNYGGRGITICDEWKESFEAFYCDMGSRPSDDHSIDRKDNDKGYCKENCRWATRTEQQNNRRSNLIYEFDGEIKTLAEWCREYNADYMSVYQRITVTGMEFEDAINKTLKSVT